MVWKAIGTARLGCSGAEIMSDRASPSLIAAENRTILEEVVSNKAAVGNTRAQGMILPSEQPGNPYIWGQ
jgi:hypothetical protein